MAYFQSLFIIYFSRVDVIHNRVLISVVLEILVGSVNFVSSFYCGKNDFELSLVICCWSAMCKVWHTFCIIWRKSYILFNFFNHFVYSWGIPFEFISGAVVCTEFGLGGNFGMIWAFIALCCGVHSVRLSSVVSSAVWGLEASRLALFGSIIIEEVGLREHYGISLGM